MKNKLIIPGICKHISDLFRERYPRSYFYYNLSHTKALVKSVTKLACTSQLSKDELFVLEAAAWFHDIFQLEYLKDPATDPNELENLLDGAGIDSKYVEQIITLNLGEIRSRIPATLSEKIYSDGVRFYWAKKSYSHWSEALRQDTQYFNNIQIPASEWSKQNLILMQRYNDHYPDHTIPHSKKRLKNLTRLELKIAYSEHHHKSRHDHIQEVSKANGGEKHGKAAEIMFKITSTNNQRFTSLGDNKAHILITVNSIILSVIISILLRKLDESSYLIYPTFILLSVTIVSIVFSILSTRPSLLHGRYKRRLPENQSQSLLFFGNFYRMNLTDYTAAMLSVMEDDTQVFQSLINDNYGQGVVLGRKYHLLRIAYSVFMYGLILSVLAFLIAYGFHRPSTIGVPLPK